MTTVKIAVSLPRHLVTHAKRRVQRGKAESVSAYVAGALEERARSEDLEVLLREMLDATGGPLTAAERREADAALGIAPSKEKARRTAKRSR